MVEARLSDILTDFSCSALVTELAKFILYSKQQIPFSFDKLSYAVYQKRNQNDVSNYKKHSPSERLFKVAEKSIDTLEEIFEKTSKEFSNSNVVSEVVFLLGGSILTPKQVYRIRLPNLEMGHNPKHHSRQKMMSSVFKALVESDELHQMLIKPLEPTNMFILFRLHGHPDPETWLLPKPRYNIPSFGQQINLNFLFDNPAFTSCCCNGFKFYSDVSVDHTTSSPIITKPNAIMPSTVSSDVAQLWYQVPLVFKGFKDVYVKGLSVSKYWFTVGNEEIQTSCES